MTWFRAAAAAGALATVVGAGFVAGSNAAGQLNGFYKLPRVHEFRTLMPESRSSEWDGGVPDYPEAGPIALHSDAGVAERAFFDKDDDLREIDRAVERQASVRVHRGSREPARADAVVPEPQAPEPPATIDDAATGEATVTA